MSSYGESRVRPLWVIAVLAITLLWRAPSFVDPPWVNDEGTYFAVAQAMAHGYRLYAGVWENKPPALYLLYELVYHPFGATLPAVRILATLAVLSLVVLVVALSGRFASPSQAPAASMLAGLIMGVPFLEGTTANAEVFLVVFTSAAVWLALREQYFVAGLAASLAVLFKAVAGFDAAAILVFLVIRGSLCPGPDEPSALRWRRALAYVVGLVIPLGVTCLLAAVSGILGPMVEDALLYPLGYVGHANGGGVPWLLLLKVSVLVMLTVWLVRRPFPGLWFVWAAAGALSSGRFFGHYALQVVPPLCVLFAMWLATRPPRWSRRAVVGLPAAFALFAAGTAVVGWGMATSGRDTILARRLQWYANFTRLAAGQEPYATYRNQVDDHVTRNILVAHRLRELAPGKLLVWGNTPWVYVLSDRLPATPYTSSLRQPEVPGETRTLRFALKHEKPVAVVVIEPPLPPLGPATRWLATRYRKVTRLGDAGVYAARARPAPRPAR